MIYLDMPHSKQTGYFKRRREDGDAKCKYNSLARGILLLLFLFRTSFAHGCTCIKFEISINNTYLVFVIYVRYRASLKFSNQRQNKCPVLRTLLHIVGFTNDTEKRYSTFYITSSELFKHVSAYMQ